MILEVDLYNLIAQTEHDSMASSHPFLHIHRARSWSILWTDLILLSMLVRCTLLSCARLQVLLEVLQESHFLLQSLRELIERILRKHVLLLIIRYWLALIVVKAGSLVLCHDLSWVIEEDPCRLVRKKVAQPILGRVVYPLCHPNCALACHLYLLLLLWW